MKPIRLLLVDDHAVVRNGLAAILSRLGSEFQVVAEAGDGLEAEALYRKLRPDVVLTDLRMPRRDGVATIAAIHEIDPQAKIIILTTYDPDEDIYQGLRAGARGYLLKDAELEQIFDAIRAVAKGLRYLPPAIASKLADRLTAEPLSAREQEVLDALARGLSNKQIAARLDLSEGTVKFHTNGIYGKLGVSSRAEALRVAVERGLVRLGA
jgi:two-component system NarL family response regulator